MKKLIDKVKKGDRKAEQELYKIANKEIDLTLRKYVDCEPTKKDIKQETLIRIFTKLHLYDYKKGKFSAWVFRITYNETMKVYNKKEYRKECYIVNNDNDVYNFDFYFLDNTTSDTVEIDYNKVKQVKKTIEKLKPGQKQAVTLYDIEGYSHQEIAGILNVSINTTKSQLSRGRKRIKELLNN
jgi:RNA polymerase sigma-70 factor (ECF subfamily)